MDLNRVGDKVTGVNGVFQHLLEGVLADNRWMLRWAGWNDDATVRTLELVFNNGANYNPLGFISITIAERYPEGD